MQNVILLFNSRRGRPWFLKIICSTIIFFSMVVNANAQKTVSGTVTDESGVPMLGVNVIVKGTTTGTNTDFDGNYSLNVSGSNAVLVFSYLGFVTKELTVGAQSVINVTLDQDIAALSEVVVIGYGTQRRESVTGSVVSIKGEELGEVQAANFQQALQGRAAGVQISTTNSRPGAAPQIQIRGVRSLSANNDPLIVLNGIPFSGGLSDINMNDIESLDILKDASATAIYGSRGANGVILITTKSGKQGQKARFSYNTYYATKEVFAKYPMMNGPQTLALREATALFRGSPIYDTGGDEDPNVDTDWQDLFYGPGFQTSHDISVQGGTQGGAYNMGMGYFKETSVVPGEYFERYSLRAQIDQEIGAFRFGLNSVMNFNKASGISGVGGVLGSSPLLNPYNPDGSIKQRYQTQADDLWIPTRDVVNNVGLSRVNEQLDFGTYNNIYGEVKIPGVEGLKYRINIGLNLRVSRDGNFTGVGVFNYNESNPSSASYNSSISQDYVIENQILYDRTFADKHKVNFVGLFSAQNSKFDNVGLSIRNVPNEQFLFYNIDAALAEDITGYGTNLTETGLLSYMARAMYQFDNRYLITATVRSDGSSRLAEGYKWVTYPAVSVGWNVHNESFMQNVGFIDQLKLRVGYGETSNQAIGAYSTQGRLQPRNYNFGSTFATGYYVSTLPNPTLGWEFSETYNYGIDFGMFKNRLSGTVEYYITKTNDILYGLGLPVTSGVNNVTSNIGATENKGLEIALNGIIIDNPDGLTWEAGLNLYTNRNKITALASGELENVGNNWFVGSPINVIYDQKKIGLWNETDPDFQYLQQYEPGGNAGMIKVQYTGDFNPDGSPTRPINADDRIIQDPTPDFQGGFNTRLAYKNFDLSMVGTFKSGGIVISTLYSGQGYLNLLTGRRNNVDVDYWTPTNTGAKYPAPGGIQSGDNQKYASTLGYFDGSYLKVRTITFGYNFDQDILSKIGLERLRLYATVQNPFVLFSPFHDESGMDPETNSLGGQNAAVGGGPYSQSIPTIGANTPSTRNYMIGLNLTF
ncbi:SusC/RagA family TonB-linked outer membrane protein [Confluentibacter flavum]|uniref:SusC/RagA family protein n=1 Tax=Confluentibacter flavum TaxID=1909700 RepID=A0A2N3HKR9_9FLAO|nr:TonB-dependent receptor [Confluentibacter flavum]PKQ45565.1 SusC/RagA family protein [Confluentibacter flavum]